MRTDAVLVCLMGLLAVGCGRVIPHPATLEIPEELNEQSVQIPILSALVVARPPPSHDPREEMTEEAFERLVWGYYVARPGRAWVVESRAPGAIVGVIERDAYALRVRVRYDERAARVEIVDSRGLDQSETMIHRKAVGWVLKLESRIRAGLAEMARMSKA